MIGTAFKFIRHPPKSASHFFLKGFCAIGVGTLAGGLSQEWFHFGPWVSLSIASTASYLSDEVFRAVETHGAQLKHWQFPWNRKP